MQMPGLERGPQASIRATGGEPVAPASRTCGCAGRAGGTGVPMTTGTCGAGFGASPLVDPTSSSGAAEGPGAPAPPTGTKPPVGVGDALCSPSGAGGASVLGPACAGGPSVLVPSPVDDAGRGNLCAFLGPRAARGSPSITLTK